MSSFLRQGAPVDVRVKPPGIRRSDACVGGMARYRDCSCMAQRAHAGPERPRKTHAFVGDSEQDRQSGDEHEARDWSTSTGFAAQWMRAVVRAEHDLLRYGAALAVLDVVTALSACFVPWLRPVLVVARFGVLVVVIPAALRALAIQHADREDSELVKAIAVSIGLAAAYIAVRTYLVVQMCSL